MQLAIEFVSKEKNSKKERLQNLKGNKSRSQTTQASRGEELIAIFPANEIGSVMTGDDSIELPTEKNLKNKIRAYDKNWSKETGAKQLNYIDNEKRTNFLL